MDRPLMFNHARGLWGYTGTASDGEPLTIQATGLGAASAAIVTAELCALGMATFVRIGTARTLDAAGGPAPGAVITVTGALAADGPSRALGAVGTVLPDATLTERLTAQTGAQAVVATADLPQPSDDDLATWAGAGARACDLQTATVLQVARANSVTAAAVLVVSGPVTGDAHTPVLDDDALLAAVTAAAHAAAAALGLPPRQTPPLPPPRDDERVSA
jgi:uridine phosphorylase